MIKRLTCVFFVVLLSFPAFALDKIPDLTGFGTATRGAYDAANDPEICVVNSLATTDGNPTWTANYGSNNIDVYTGTLNQCLEGLDTATGGNIGGHVVAANSGKIVVFEVSGTIAQTGVDGENATFIYDVESYTDIYGQTSPDPGILLKNIQLKITSPVEDVVLQHLRIRLDGAPSMKENVHKGVAIENGASNADDIILDHLSVSWGGDGNVVVYNNGTGSISDVTISHCLVSEGMEYDSLDDSVDGSDSKAINIAGRKVAGPPTNILLYKNLISNTQDRTPQQDQSDLVMINNYMYNNGWFSAHIKYEDYPSKLAAVGNVVDGGPYSGTYSTNKFPSFRSSPWKAPLTDHEIYLYDNKTEAGTQSDSTDWSYVDDRLEIGTDFKETGEDPPNDAPVWPTGVTYISSANVKAVITNIVGAYPVFRDSVDSRLITEMTDGTGTSTKPEGDPTGWPSLTSCFGSCTELAIPASPHTDAGSGYTNLEVWIHGLSNDVEGAVRTGALPSGVQACTSDPRNITLAITTDRNSTCKYDTSDTTYALMGDTYTITGGTSHSETISLACGDSYVYYTRCTVTGGVANDDSTSHSFSIDAAEPPAVTKSYSISGGGCSGGSM